MPSIYGKFAMHRIQTPDGRNAIMLVPEKDDDVLRYVHIDDPDDERTLDSAAIEFRVCGEGDHPPDSYLTLDYPAEDLTLHFGPYVAVAKKLN